MPEVNKKTTITYSKEDIEKLILEDVKKNFTNFDLSRIWFNLSTKEDELSNNYSHVFNNAEIEIIPKD